MLEYIVGTCVCGSIATIESSKQNKLYFKCNECRREGGPYDWIGGLRYVRKSESSIKVISHPVGTPVQAVEVINGTKCVHAGIILQTMMSLNPLFVKVAILEPYEECLATKVKELNHESELTEELTMSSNLWFWREIPNE